MIELSRVDHSQRAALAAANARTGTQSALRAKLLRGVDKEQKQLIRLGEVMEFAARASVKEKGADWLCYRALAVGFIDSILGCNSATRAVADATGGTAPAFVLDSTRADIEVDVVQYKVAMQIAAAFQLPSSLLTEITVRQKWDKLKAYADKGKWQIALQLVMRNDNKKGRPLQLRLYQYMKDELSLYAEARDMYVRVYMCICSSLRVCLRLSLPITLTPSPSTLLYNCPHPQVPAPPHG